MIVLDASVLIAHLSPTDAHHARAGALLLDLAADDLTASPITRAEALVNPARAGDLPAVAAALDQFLSEVPLDPASPAALALLRAETNLALPDCCVILAAEQTHAAIATFDSRLAKAARARGITVHN